MAVVASAPPVHYKNISNQPCSQKMIIEGTEAHFELKYKLNQNCSTQEAVHRGEQIRDFSWFLFQHGLGPHLYKAVITNEQLILTTESYETIDLSNPKTYPESYTEYDLQECHDLLTEQCEEQGYTLRHPVVLGYLPGQDRFVVINPESAVSA